MIRRYLARIFGPESVYPDLAAASVTEAIVDHSSAGDALSVWASIDRCATVAADAILTTSPELDRDSLRRAVAQELWMATQQVADLARSGARLV